MLSVAADAESANATVMCAAANTAALDLVAAQFEPSVVRDNAAHLVTVMHGLDLLNMRQALLESHRILKPGGHLVVAFTDRWGCAQGPEGSHTLKGLCYRLRLRLALFLPAHVPGACRISCSSPECAHVARTFCPACFQLVLRNCHLHMTLLLQGPALQPLDELAITLCKQAPAQPSGA